MAQRRRDLTRRKDARRDLVQQRLEEVVVAPVDQRDIDLQVPEEATGREPAEAATDHDDAMARADPVGHDTTPASELASQRAGHRSTLVTPSAPRAACALAERGVEADGRGDQREMRERLREVAELFTGVTDLLPVQPEVVGVREHLLEHEAGVVDPPGARERVDVPERAHRERAFGAAQTVG